MTGPGLEGDPHSERAKGRRLTEEWGAVQPDLIEVVDPTESAPDPVFLGTHLHPDRRLDAEHSREPWSGLVELVAAPRSARTVQITAVAHPSLDSGRSVGTDVRVDGVQDVIVLEPSCRDILLGKHVDQVLFVHEGEISGAALQHVDVSPGLPQVGADAVEKGHPRLPDRARSDDVLRA